MDVATAQGILSGFAGGTARLWSFTSSHDRLTVELNDASRAQRKYLVLIGCTQIHLPSWWRVKNLRIDQADSGFVLADEEVRVLFEHEFQIADADQGSAPPVPG